MKSKLIIEQHIHGAFGVDFNTCSEADIKLVAEKLLTHGIGGFFPTLVTDNIENIKRQIAIIKNASIQQPAEQAKILGIHLEGIFINPKRKGIHNEQHFLSLTKENYKLIEDDFIKIITLAPELDVDLIDYLKTQNIKIQAGHCEGSDLSKCDGVTHLFNAMKGISHRDNSTALSALTNGDVYTEIIADGVHLSDEILTLIFNAKCSDKIILISDALPITYSDIKETTFADETIYYDGIKATSKEGTIAGSTTLVSEIIPLLAKKNLLNRQVIKNPYLYHNIDIDGFIELDDDYNIIAIEKDGVKIK